MINWWENLTIMGQIFAIIAIPSTIVMILQSFLLLFGVGFGGDSDVDSTDHSFDGSDGLSLFTLRGLVAFFSIGGWTGLVCTSGNLNNALSIIIAFFAGSLALVGIAFLLKFSFKMQDKGNLDILNALGKVGNVYIPILESRKGNGKITILVQGRLIEITAITDDNRTLKTGEMVIVKEIINGDTVLVSSEIGKIST